MDKKLDKKEIKSKQDLISRGYLSRLAKERKETFGKITQYYRQLKTSDSGFPTTLFGVMNRINKDYIGAAPGTRQKDLQFVRSVIEAGGDHLPHKLATLVRDMNSNATVGSWINHPSDRNPYIMVDVPQMISQNIMPIIDIMEAMRIDADNYKLQQKNNLEALRLGVIPQEEGMAIDHDIIQQIQILEDAEILLGGIADLPEDEAIEAFNEILTEVNNNILFR